MSERLQPILQAKDLTKSFKDGASELQVLKALSLEVSCGESLAVVGASGSGKTSLLHLLGGLDQPSGGSVCLAGQSLANLNANECALLRNQHLGFVYQFHHLLSEFSAVENVAMPLWVRKGSQKGSKSEAISRATDLLEQVGLSDRLKHKPNALSGGERQRVAIARALVTEPDCVLMDEPTGNLDHTTAAAVIDLIFSLQKRYQMGLVVVTHDESLAARLDRILRLA